MLHSVTGAPVIRQLSKQRGDDGQHKVLVCEAEGSPKPSVSWSINGTSVCAPPLPMILQKGSRHVSRQSSFLVRLPNMPRLFEVEQETCSQPSPTYSHMEVRNSVHKLKFCNKICKILFLLVRSLIYPVSVTLGTDTLLKLVEKVNWKIMLHQAMHS